VVGRRTPVRGDPLSAGRRGPEPAGGVLAVPAAAMRPIAGGRLRACGPPVKVLTSGLLTEVYQREVEVLAHPRTGPPLVVAVR
jgi:iron complex transport system ATP-binding protein